MLYESDWIYHLTGAPKSAEDKYGNPAPYFRKTFSLKDAVKTATLFASALGVFKLYLNGSEVANDYLSPGWVDYRKKLPLMRYDVTALLQQDNAVAAVLADGWAVGHLGSTLNFRRNGYSDRIEFTAILRIEYIDGTVENITTDESWKASTGAIRRSDIFMGEYIDNRLNLGDFSRYDYDDSAWDYAQVYQFKFSRNLYLMEIDIPPIVVKHTFTPKLLRKRDNTYLYDVSQNISGVLRCVFQGNAGDTVTIRHGELLSDGELYTENLRKAEATDTYILSGNGEEIFRPLFTFHGFRYAELTLTGDVQIVSICAEAMYTDLKSTGEFSCSDPIVNRIYLNALWGQRDNFLNIPTDCPQRDERLGWTGDAQVFCQSAMLNMDCRRFYAKYLADVREAQLGNGVIPAIAPLPPMGSHAYTGYDAAAGWCEAIGEIPYTHYKMYGDKQIIRDNLPALKKLIGYYQTESPDYIRRNLKKYGDWLSLGQPSDLTVISTLFYARAAQLAAALCQIVGDDQQDKYQDLYQQIKSAFCREFIDANGKIFSDTQSVYIIAYSFGIIDLESLRTHLLRKFEEDGQKLTSGFLGIRFLLPAFCDIGRKDIAYRLITNTEFPGWGYSVVNGATTIWERWDGYTKEAGIRKGMNSFNHYSFGSCTEWMYMYCLGIRPSMEKPGCKKVDFVPYIDTSGKLTFAKGHYDTDYGRIAADWEKQGEKYIYTVTVPKPIECTFRFPEMTVLHQSTDNGTYVFTLSAQA